MSASDTDYHFSDCSFSADGEIGISICCVADVHEAHVFVYKFSYKQRESAAAYSVSGCEWRDECYVIVCE